ncbi:YIP1 family protein [Pukyongiella litopenaei]|uniref:YIP1 family protein n=1 Tax=Pukyongiella litopenaei TaxID=2605946 RepID=A0A2S0MTM7_9RHOB|nr:YIP1 family protein [Pukyongiella litopenaei]AVO39222.1 YIP1 family protein [Pukyongiella litopenaei]
MTIAVLRNLIVETLRDPARTARYLMSLRIAPEALWTGLGLVAVLNTLLFSLSDMLVPGPAPLPGVFASPIVYFLLVAAALVLTVYALFWTGRLFGGTGGVDQILVLIVWLQSLRLLVQVITLVLALTIPALSLLVVLFAAVAGLYITLHFVNEAHRLGSLFRSSGVLVATALAIVLGLSLVLSLIGGPVLGVAAHV